MRTGQARFVVHWWHAVQRQRLAPGLRADGNAIVDGGRLQLVQDDAFDWLNRLTAEMASEYLGNPATEPIWSPLYDDPRWEPWLASRGISKDQLFEYVFDFKLSRQ